MKFKSVLLLCAAVVSTWAADLAVNWQESLAQTPPGSAAVKGWQVNNFRKSPKIGTGEVIEENGVKHFQIETTGMDTNFFMKKSFPAKAGDTLEIEVTAKGKGYLIVSCYCYEQNKFFIPANYKIQYILPQNEKKSWTIRKKLADGKKGEKLSRITLTIGGGGKSSISVYDYKARIVK